MFNNHLKKIIDIFESSSITSIEITSFWGFRKIKLGKENKSYDLQNSSAVHQALEPIKEENIQKVEPSAEEVIPDSNSTVHIMSPLVGTFYLSPKPGSPPFINEGDSVEIGQTLCIVEAMKIFNEIESDLSGKIVKILVEDGSPVEYDQPLMIIKQ
tara:strand:- start:125 stop:592 length:468 start_codon:yes stop_codon:yes gene_type:complete